MILKLFLKVFEWHQIHQNLNHFLKQTISSQQIIPSISLILTIHLFMFLIWIITLTGTEFSLLMWLQVYETCHHQNAIHTSITCSSKLASVNTFHTYFRKCQTKIKEKGFSNGNYSTENNLWVLIMA